jgi:4-diphosphocytidyl-2-C-methyl-D-erythritol kinase
MSAPPPGQHVAAPAKLTLSLRVTGTRDDGFHLLDAEMVALDLHDELLFAAGDGLVVRGSFATGAQGPGAADLVAGALALAGRQALVHLTKRIPAGAGLGGGSADAAAVLRWAGWTGTAGELAAAAALGADVAFCLVGGRARVRGIGELVDPLPFVAQRLTLVTPPFGCPTPVVYATWDRLGGPVGDGGNDLEPAAVAAEPRLAEWRDRIGAATGRLPRLAGSGSTWFVEDDHVADLAGLAAQGAHVALARTVPAGWSPGPAPPEITVREAPQE